MSGALPRLMAIALLTLAGTSAPGQSGATGTSEAGAEALRRQVLPAGGGLSAGGPYALHGSIGQSEADPLNPASGGPYELRGGFWPSGGQQVDLLLRDGFEGTP